MFVEQLGMPSRPKWHAGAKTLVLEQVSPGEEGPSGGSQRGFSARGSKRGGGRGGGGGRDGQGSGGGRGASKAPGGSQGPADAKLDPSSPEFCYGKWIDSLASSVDGGLLNSASLQPVSLPLQVSTASEAC